MRRSERLAELLVMVGSGRLHLARDLAAALEVSVRTIYRDIDTLVASGVPIEGERGIGYMLREPVFLPAMALTLAELEALSLGMAIVSETADDQLKAAAQNLLRKVEGHVGVRRRLPGSWGFGLYEFGRSREGLVHMPLIRQALRESMKLRICYLSLSGKHTQRTVRPLQLEYWGKVWTCAAWCETGNAFRTFRVDRIGSCQLTGETFQPESGRMHQDYLRHIQVSMAGSDRSQTAK